MNTARESKRFDLWHVRDAIRSQWLFVLLAGALSVTVVGLWWIAHRAFGGWQQSSALLAEQRGEEKATLLSIALERNMKAVQNSVLGRFGGRRLAFRHPNDLFDLVASAFSQYPYADSIFVWRAEPRTDGGRLYVFNRADRSPGWAVDLQRPSPFPVAVVVDPPPLLPVLEALRTSQTREQFLLNEIVAGGAHYQVVSSLFFDSGGRQPLASAVGFLVDLAWVREHYFDDWLREMETVIGENDVSLSILDDKAIPVAITSGEVGASSVFERRFPFAFLDRSLLAAQLKPSTVRSWSIRVRSGVSGESSPEPWSDLRWLMSFSAAASLVSVILMAQSITVIARHAAARSDFVARVTHDLKTPLALVQAVGETLEFGRHPPDRSIEEYGRLLRLQAAQLQLRIDNVLAFARANETGEDHRGDTIDLLDVIHDSLHRAEPRLSGFELDEHLADAPLVAGDYPSLVQVFDNLIDNAVKYSNETKYLGIRAKPEGAFAVVVVEDRGIGIAPADLAHVFEKFFRGRSDRPGSGLGLTIAQAVVQAHRGTIAIASRSGRGTTVTVRLPLKDTV